MISRNNLRFLSYSAIGLAGTLASSTQKSFYSACEDYKPRNKADYKPISLKDKM